MKFCVLILLLTYLNSKAQDGSLDNTFGTSGLKNIDFGLTNEFAHTLAIQNDGKIIAGGKTYNGTNYDFALIRLNTNGSLDNTFGMGGYVVTSVQSGNDFIKSIKIQSDGKILVAGTTYYGAWIQDFCLVRYNSNGTLDNSFGTNGIVITDVGSVSEFANSLVIQSDGKIVVAGHTTIGTQYDFALVRYNSNGSLDNTFGTSGIVKTDIGTSNDEAYSVALQSDGKILVAGGSYNGSNFDFALVRYNSDGSLDNSFNSSGKYTSNFFGYYDMAYSVLTQTDDKIIISGTAENIGSNRDFAAIRLNSDGSVDNSFGTNGKVSVNMMTTNDFCYSSALQSDNKILLCGYTDYSLSILRLNSDGSIDYSFDYDGKVLTAVGGSWNESNSIAIQSDGKIVVAGNGYYNNMMVSTYDFVITRYTNISLLPVELTSFNAKFKMNNVELNWTTETEANNYGFEIERAVTLSTELVEVSKGDHWQKIGFVKGSGNSNSPKQYSFVDNSPASGKLKYRLKQIDNDGSFSYSNEIEIDVDIPKVFALNQNYPNPFNPTTTITFTLAEDGLTTLKIYDILGREVHTLVNEELKAGQVYKIDFDGSKLASGVYFYKLESKSMSKSKRFVLMK
jgi:uncharacterized delta-60 repeat protein